MPDEQDTAPQDTQDTQDPQPAHSRDLTTLEEDGPQLTQFESRHVPGKNQRPRFSPVAQPGMVDEIHWGTVRTTQGGTRERPPARQQTRGMFGRLHEERGGQVREERHRG